MKRFTLATATAVALLAAGTASASAATRAVDEDSKATPRNCDATTPATPSIQTAVNESQAGDTIVVCPGTYAEQVRVPADKDRLTLISRERRQAIIKAPPAYANGTLDLVRVDGAENVSFASFTITGPQPDSAYCNEQLVSNVRIGQGGSANLVDNPHHQGEADCRRPPRLPERVRRPDRPQLRRRRQALHRAHLPRPYCRDHRPRSGGV